MSHVKFISTPAAWSMKDFLDGVVKTLNWNHKDVENIKLIHVEDLRNNRNHIRMSFYDISTNQTLKKAGTRTSNINIRNININDKTVLMEIMDNTRERFKLNDLRRDTSNIPHRTLLVNFEWDENLLNICNKLSALKILKVEYMSQNKNNSFIKFNNDVDINRFIHLLKVQNYRYKYAATYLSLLKFSVDSNENNVNNNDDGRRRILIRNDDNDKAQNPPKGNSFVIPEEINIKIDNIAENIATAVNNRFNRHNLNTISNVNLPDQLMFNNMHSQFNPYMLNIPSNLNAYNMHMNLMSQQLPNNHNNLALLNGLFRSQNLNYANFPHFY